MEKTEKKEAKGMSNIATKVEGNMLWIVIDLSVNSGPSSTGKSTIIGSTHGNVDIGNGVKLSVNAYKALPKAPKA